jgi:multidrug efflux system membrane fusion protein
MPETRSGKIGPDHQLSFRKKKSPLKLLIGIAAVVLIAIAAGWLLTHLGGPAGGAAGPGGPGGPGGAGGGRGGGRGGFGGRAAITVGTAPVTIGAIPIQLDALGTVTPPVTAIITPRISGELMAVYFTEGQNVKKGQKLALIDPRPYKVALEQAQGTLARDQAALADARLDLQRYTTLLAQNSIAKQQVDTQAALVKQDEGVVKTDQAGVDNAKLNLAYTSITAPVAGRVGLRQVDVGNYISAGLASGLVVITQVDPIDVVFTVPEDNVPQIVGRQRSGASLPVTVFNRGGVEALAQGQLSTLDNQIDTGTGTVKAKARFTNGSGALFPNQFVNARMLVDVLCNAVVVPTTAVRHGSQGDYVFVLQPDRTAKMVSITTGAGTGETVSVTKGLMGNETVITEGGDRLRDGSQVNLPGDKVQGGSGFSGGKRRSGARAGQGGAAGASAGRQGGSGQSGFRRRGGQGGAPAAAQVAGADSENPNTSVQGLPTAQAPPGACSAAGKGQGQGFAGRRFGGQGAPAGAPQGAPGQGGQAQGFQRRFGQGQGAQGQGAQGAPGQGFRHRQGGQGGAPGQGQPQGQGQAG